MGEQKMPNPNQNQPGKDPQKDRESASRPGQQNPQQERESASRQPGKQFPGENPEPKEHASNPDRQREDAARRQSKQDPLQNRDR